MIFKINNFFNLQRIVLNYYFLAVSMRNMHSISLKRSVFLSQVEFLNNNSNIKHSLQLHYV